MKALIKKDILILMKYMKWVIVFFIGIAAFGSILSGDFSSGFLTGILIIFPILPITALSYDETSKWDSLAVTMPYSSKQIVLSKFVLGYIGSGVAVFLSAVFNVFIPYIMNNKVDTENVGTFISTITGQSIGIAIMAFLLAFSYRFGLQKGKIMLIALCAFVGAAIPVITSVIALDIADIGIRVDNNYFIPAVAFAFALIINAVSIPLSVKCYKSRRFISK